MEVTPPAVVWEKLSLNIDEINEDNRVAKKVLGAQLTPPFPVWEKINAAIAVDDEPRTTLKKPVINLRRFALAAILIGVIVTGWMVFQNFNQNQASVAVLPVEPTQKATQETDTAKTTKQNESVANPIESSDQPATRSLSSIGITFPESRNDRNSSGKKRDGRTAQARPVQFASLNTPLAKNFDRSIDDLSLVTADQRYLTMVNANGRLVKIPAQLASLAPHLQNKPVSEDIYEIMFGEGLYWKETLKEWRKKVASVPVASGDAFTSFIELLKSVQDQ